MKTKYTIPDHLILATEKDFRKNSRLKLGVKYWYYCFGERKLVTHITSECTDIKDLKSRIAFKDVYLSVLDLD